jgi:2-methylisocitrate lyase-like PEP mutase family enzyme
MADQNAKAEQFAALHKKGEPLILFNAWDPGSAKVVAGAGAKAIATGSYSVASAFGYADGETTPLETVLDNGRRIAAAVEVPVTLDFEGGYAVDPAAVERNVATVIATGVVGINFEDRVIGGEGLHEIKAHAARIAAARAAADKAGVAFFINARCDLFLGSDRATHAGRIAECLERGRAYADAGASGLFAPGLVDPKLIGELAEASPLPLNIMMMSGAPDVAALRALGVARISYGGGPYREAMTALDQAARAVFAS